MDSDAAAVKTGVASEPGLLRPYFHLPIIASVILALVAAGIVYGVYHATFPLYDVPKHLLRMFPSDEDAVKREQCKDFARTLHATATLGMLAGLLALFLGGGEALSARTTFSRIPRIFSGVIIAVILGALGGLLGAQVIVRLEQIIELQGQAMTRTVLGQMTMFALLGLGVGFAAGVVSGNRRLLYSAMGAGLAVGIIAGVVFPILAALVLPGVQTDVVIPDGSGGIFGLQQAGRKGFAIWLAIPCFLIGVLIRPIANRQKAPKTTTAVVDE